jgi:ribosomal protein S6--L-glutamate ligase
MKIAILSRAPKSYSTKRLREAAAQRGHTARVLNTLRFSIHIEHGAPDLLFRGKAVSTYDAIIPRIGASVTYFGTAVVRQFEQMGVFSLAPATGITYSRDKLRSLQMLSRYDIGIPDTAFVRDRYDILDAIDRVGGAPVIIKLLEGTQGVGVILAETQKVAEAIIETLQSARQNVLIQKFVAESKGKDVRAFVVGDRVVAAMRRTAQGTEFRSNVHRGGLAESIELSEEYRETAVVAAQVLGLQVAGVDMLEGKDGPQVMEVNSSPGLEGIETASGVDVAGAIIEHIEQRVEFSEVDLRYRLASSKGYGVVELPIVSRSSLAGKPLSETKLRERDITVLSIRRGRKVVSNPSGERHIEEGDVLLCFGKLDEIRTLMPKPSRKPKSKLRKKTGTKKPRTGDPESEK